MSYRKSGVRSVVQGLGRVYPRARGWFLGIALALLSPWALAQAGPVPLQNVLNLSANSFVEVPQDWMQMQLSTTREGSDAATVQAQLKQALDAALTKARRDAKPGSLEVRTGAFQIHPRYSQQGKVNGWRGTVELWLEGRDVLAISRLAGQIDTLTVAQVGFDLSREARQQLEAQVQAQAIERFKERADAMARSFGFAGYTLREVSVTSAEPEGVPMYPRMRAMAVAAPMADAAVPVQAGKTTVSITVSGAIQLR